MTELAVYTMILLIAFLIFWAGFFSGSFMSTSKTIERMEHAMKQTEGNE